MIILSTDDPQNSLYYLGSILLEIMSKNAGNNFGIYDHFEIMNQYQSVTMNRFLLVLDWLFMLGKISSNSDEGLRLCT